MQVVEKKLSDTKIQLTLVADAELLGRVKQDALTFIGKDMKLAGFRPGKAPAAVVEKNASQTALQSEFLDRAMNALYGAALDEKNLRPVAQPEVKVTKFVPYDTLELEVVIEVIGDVKLPDYKKTTLAKKPVKVTAKDVDAVLDDLQTREAEKKEVTRAAKKGDQATIAFKGVDAKTKDPISGAEGKDYPLTLGSNTFIPGFEDNVIGMKPGEEKAFTLAFPKDYGVKALQNRKVTFTVTLSKLEELHEPKIDDAFAAKVGPFKTVQELKEDIKKQLQTEGEAQSERAYADELITKLTSQTKAALPESLINRQLDRLVDEQKQNLIYRGQTWQEFLEGEKKTEEEYRASLKPEAELRVRAGLMLSEIAEKEKIDVTRGELDAQIQYLKSRYTDPQMQAELDKPESRREIASRMMSEKTILKLVEYASSKK